MEHVESFLDELITWRELGYNMCSQRDDYDQYDSLPDWAQSSIMSPVARTGLGIFQSVPASRLFATDRRTEFIQ